MKNLIPHYTIGVLGVIGLAIWGFWGLLGGLFVGYILVSLFGLALLGFSGGILPRRVRQDTAQRFLALNAEWLQSRIPNQYKGKEVVFIETLLEKIFRKAAVIGPSTSPGMSYGEASFAVEILKSEEENPYVIDILDRLWMFLEHEWYSLG